MPLQRSPGGSIFPYFYKNGELFGLHFGSFESDEAGVIARIREEQVFFLEQDRTMAVWMDLYQTRLSADVLAALIDFLKYTGHRVPKLGLFGCSMLDKWRITRQINMTGSISSMNVRFFDDPEAAKTWLVSEY
jgi:hypothetical protein